MTMFGLGRCARCGAAFVFDPDTVLTVRVNPHTALPDQHGQPHPVCPACAPLVRKAARTGQPLSWPAARHQADAESAMPDPGSPPTHGGDTDGAPS